MKKSEEEKRPYKIALQDIASGMAIGGNNKLLTREIAYKDMLRVFGDPIYKDNDYVEWRGTVFQEETQKNTDFIITGKTSNTLWFIYYNTDCKTADKVAEYFNSKIGH